VIPTAVLVSFIASAIIGCGLVLQGHLIGLLFIGVAIGLGFATIRTGI